ncbi:MFS transporter [Geotalea uraniireducens]|uniref:Major facilitator superfamily MFS_1 n=1 Tax=Geotalea uraniireducens (strain Rf4) TaxID=351605 RepID=A5G572_GEOUR|nr:MFS transporter [Geotalea uraniireducens]ABQ26940.1 major facilitator superfamily MFS_1 [Geotalea uraniireducens Rf4]
MNANERKVAWLASLSHGVNHGYMTLLPAVLVVLAGDQSLGFFALGAIINVGYCLFGVGSIPAGIMADRLGAKKMLVLGLWGMAISAILVGLSPGSWSFGFAYALLGLTASIYHPSGLSLIAHHIAKKGKALSLHGILGNLGLSLAPLFAGTMVMLFDTWRAAYIAFGILGLIFAFVVQITVIDGENEWSRADLMGILSWRPFRPLSNASGAVTIGAEASTAAEPAVTPPVSKIPVALLVLYGGSILFGFVYRGSLTFFPALFQQEINFVSTADQPVMVAGMLTSAILTLGIFGQWLGGYLSDRARHPELVHIGIYLIVIPAAYYISRYTNTSLIVASIVFTLVFYGWQPIQNSLIASYTAKRSYGKGYGWNFFFIMGMGSIATLVGGYIVDSKGVDAVYTLLAALSILGLMVSILAYTLRYRSDVARNV